MKVRDRQSGEVSDREVRLTSDEGNRPQTTLDALASLQPVFKDGLTVAEGRFITAGNASQLSDGASAALVMEAREAERRGLEPLGRYVGMAVAGCSPDEMGIGPVFAVPKLSGGAGAQRRGRRPLGVERGVRGAGDLLPRSARHPQRAAQRVGRRDLDRPPLRHVGRAHGRARADRGAPPRRQAGRLHDVLRRRDGPLPPSSRCADRSRPEEPQAE